MPPRHLVTVWNPSYSESAMDAHLEVLLAWSERCARGEAAGDEVYVWWAKLRSQNRQQPLPHREEILAIQSQIADEVETHLYLTDYRSLYVAKVDEITAEPILEENPGEIEHMPLYYRERIADFWFLLVDIRRLVSDDTVETIHELAKLRNLRYHDKPVSIYGGMTDLPLMVSRETEAGWFAQTDALTDGRLWVERDAEQRGEVERMSRELRDNLLGREVWGALETATRGFLAAAESTFRARREDPRFDFSGPALGYAKAVETELNAVLFPPIRRTLSRAPVQDREVRVNSRLIDLGGSVPHQTLGSLRNLLQHEAAIGKNVRIAFPHDASWLLSAVPVELAALEGIRNAGAHSEVSPRAEVTRMRERVVGIGEEGIISRIARVKMRA